MATFHKSLPFWYWKLSSKRMDKLLKAVQLIVDKWGTDLQTVRTYILKADGVRYRPLGFPKLEWRIVITM